MTEDVIDLKSALARHATRTNRLRFGLLVSLGSFWIGMHYSAFNRRWCINLLPFVTVWITLPGGYLPR